MKRTTIVGLLITMAGCGIPIPAGSNSRSVSVPSPSGPGGFSGDILKHPFWKTPPSQKEWSELLDKATDPRAFGGLVVNKKGSYLHVNTPRGMDDYLIGGETVGIDLDALKREGPITKQRAEDAFRRAMDELVTKEDYRKTFK